MNERWKNYGKDIISKDNYEVDEVIQNSEGTRIILKGETNTIIIKFGFVDALRVSDEGRRLRTYNEVRDIQEYRENFHGNPLYTVEDSEFVEWIKLESDGFYTDMTHYVLMTINDVVDILSTFPPEIITEKTDEEKNL